MELVSASRYVGADIATALDSSGREYLVIVATSTWQIPAPGQRPRPLPPQPFCHSDEIAGAEGRAWLRRGDDFARFKPRCDVLFDACAHAPGAEPVRELGAGFRVGNSAKMLRVSGPRRWRRSAGVGQYSLTEAEPFLHLPLHYGHAHGGLRTYREGGELLAEAYAANPAGCGWAGSRTLDGLHDSPAASLEYLDDPVLQPQRPHLPAALGAISRQWPQRQRHAGTTDARWMREVFPFLPEDFDERFHQAAPEDQQIDYPRGGEPVRLVNLLPDQPDCHFVLPQLQMPVRVLYRDYRSEVLDAKADTLFFETEQRRFCVVWRTQLPIRRHIDEFVLIAAGDVDADWWRQRSLGLDEACRNCEQQRASLPAGASA